MKSAFECKHVKAVTAWVLFYGWDEVGRVVANFSDGRNGSVCTCTVAIWKGPLYQEGEARTGKAGGSGYDKFSAAFYEAITSTKQGNKMAMNPNAKNLSGCGAAAVESYLVELGYRVIRVLG